MRVWVTGAAGSIGSRLLEVLPDAVGTDLDVDVTDRAAVDAFVRKARPDAVLHCAGAKHAPEGELFPRRTAAVNIDGTLNVLDAMAGRRVVLASTCKAADPETAYGASKLIAERATLNAGGSVARFFNVRETAGNVFEIWRNTPEPEPIRVAPCWRYFISLEQAVGLVLAALELPSGRWSVDPGPAVFMPDLAAELYPTRERVLIPPRRGDRIREPLHAVSESVDRDPGGLLRVSSPHDVGVWQ